MRRFALVFALMTIGLAETDGRVFAGMITVDFDDVANWTAGSGSFSSIQSDHVYRDQGFTFTGGPAFRGVTTAQDGFAGALGTYSWRLQNTTGVNWTATYSTVSISQVASLSFDARRWDGNPSPAYTVDYSINRGSTFTSLASLNNAAFDNSSAWKTFSFLINTPVLADGDFVVRFASAGTTERIMIDNFSITAVPEPTSLVLVGLAGAGGLVARRWRKKKLVGVAT